MANDDYLMDSELAPIMLDLREKNKNRPPLTEVAPQTMRMRAAEMFAPWNENPTQIAKVENFTINSPEAEIKVRLYDDCENQKTGAMVYFHGGGWVIGDLDLEDAALRFIAKESGMKILSIDYRLAPEHPYPAAIHDGAFTYEWLQANGESLNIDAKKLSYGGGSAGANVAIGSVLYIRDTFKEVPNHMALIHGVYSTALEGVSYDKYGDGRFGLPIASMQYFWNTYLAGKTPEIYCDILLDEQKNMPKNVIIIQSELDVLADEGSLLAQKLTQNGAQVEHRKYSGAYHGFTQYLKSAKIARDALSAIALSLKNSLA